MFLSDANITLTDVKELLKTILIIVGCSLALCVVMPIEWTLWRIADFVGWLDSPCQIIFPCFQYELYEYLIEGKMYFLVLATLLFVNPMFFIRWVVDVHLGRGTMMAVECCTIMLFVLLAVLYL